MNNPDKRYKLSELKVGMQVKLSELRNILDTHMVLTGAKMIGSDDLVGTLVFFGNDESAYEKWFKQSGSEPMTPVYFDSEELRDEVVYDE